MMSLRFTNSKYSLQARFQAKENARSLSFNKFVFTFGVLTVFIEAMVLVFRVPERLGDWGIVLLYIMDLLNSANPILVIPLMLIKVPYWRKKFFGEWIFAKTSPEVKTLKPRSNSQQETEEYFNHLRESWT
uniref:G_PROTEIN_RECEP_F1_2 domain-containing protein n=1 Tax=Caenorhabditis tropicalis TaxID=1561998 RepID=A0A1I7UDN9_9PELO